MKISKLIYDYSRLSDASLTLKSLNVKNSLTNNDYFPTTNPSLESFGTLHVAYEAALAKSLTGDRVQIALKNQAKTALTTAMRKLAFDIELQADGDRPKLLSSGFDVTTINDNPGIITAPTDVKMVDGLNTGEIKFSCKKVINAKSYLYEYSEETPTEETKWLVIASTSREVTIKGLRVGTRLYGRIKAIGSKGREVASEIISRLVQ